MFKYFYTVEVDLTHDLMKLEFSNTINSLFNNIVELEFTSKMFSTEKECTDSVIKDIDLICNRLLDKHLIEPPAIETYINPNLIFGKNSKEILEMSVEEKTFWKENKLALFAVFKSKEEETFMMRYVIYSIEEFLLTPENQYNLLDIESPSKFLN